MEAQEHLTPAERKVALLCLLKKLKAVCVGLVGTKDPEFASESAMLDEAIDLVSKGGWVDLEQVKAIPDYVVRLCHSRGLKYDLTELFKLAYAAGVIDKRDQLYGHLWMNLEGSGYMTEELRAEYPPPYDLTSKVTKERKYVSHLPPTHHSIESLSHWHLPSLGKRMQGIYKVSNEDLRANW